jgi:hypothetical protein
MHKLKKKNLKIDEAIEEENNKNNKLDKIFNLADSQSVEL